VYYLEQKEMGDWRTMDVFSDIQDALRKIEELCEPFTSLTGEPKRFCYDDFRVIESLVHLQEKGE